MAPHCRDNNSPKCGAAICLLTWDYTSKSITRGKEFMYRVYLVLTVYYFMIISATPFLRWWFLNYQKPVIRKDAENWLGIGTLFCHEWGVLEVSCALVDTILIRENFGSGPRASRAQEIIKKRNILDILGHFFVMNEVFGRFQKLSLISSKSEKWDLQFGSSPRASGAKKKNNLKKVTVFFFKKIKDVKSM